MFVVKTLNGLLNCCLIKINIVLHVTKLKGILIVKNHLQKHALRLLTTFFFVIFSIQVTASDFNIPFMNAAELGDMYAGWAASANDASTTYSNPAGLVRIENKQLVIAGLGIMGHSQFNGVATPPLFPFGTQVGKAPTRLRGFVPSFYYAAPLSENVVFGFGETVPFALGTNYAPDSTVRYSATKSQIAVIDVGPSLGIKISEKLSFGAGLDIDHMSLILNNMLGFPISVPDSEVHNYLTSWGYGWHSGLLYQFNPTTRLGLNYNSRVHFHANGISTLKNPITPPIQSTDLNANTTLPDLTQLSLYHALNSRWTVMGTVFYTHWSVLKEFTLKNIVIPGGGTIAATIPFNYRNTFDYSTGISFQATEKWLLRTGVEFLDLPSNDRNRLAFDPIGNAAIVGIGAHYQQNNKLGYDLGYAHGFFQKTTIHNITPFHSEMGRCSSYTNIVGVQVTWNFV